uniref:Alpha-1,3/1,6-mannosyltransferase ALG2 n=1 Tax=Panagrellus redivivus TaxID=6233 RepID=A0A7E4V0U8_PANRE
MRIVFLHPDLGIGGAERLVVDAALALKSKGHKVRFVTNHFAPNHCFQEVLDFDIQTIDVFPRNILGRFTALCAYIRMCIAALVICWFGNVDVVFIDSISLPVPLIKWFSTAKVLFYCHFPDQLLASHDSFILRAYRYILDALEGWSTDMADVVCVNSKFTEGVVRQTLTSLAERDLHVLHPTINTKFFDESPRVELDFIPEGVEHLFVSVNRFEVKKNIDLALAAFAKLHDKMDEASFSKCFLVIAGGYDPKNAENIAYYEKLQDVANQLGLPESSYAFVKSPSDTVKIELLRRASLVIYTPKNEHFGIVPIEAMYVETCVLATDTGGPRETVVHGRTGFLTSGDPYNFSIVLSQVVNNPEQVKEMGRVGRLRVERVFAFDAFASKLNNIVETFCKP